MIQAGIEKNSILLVAKKGGRKCIKTRIRHKMYIRIIPIFINIMDGDVQTPDIYFQFSLVLWGVGVPTR